jgi:hypothetical protein
MKKIFPVLFLSLIYIKTYSQSNALQEQVTYINKIIAENWRGSGIQRFEADKYGNLLFYGSTGSYWFNLNDVVGFDQDEYFLFSSSYRIRCSPDPCGERIILIGNNIYSTWGRSDFNFLPVKWRSVIIGGFSRLQEITKDPYKKEQ